MDARDVYLAAARVDSCTAELRTRADLVRLRMQTTRWRSSAATAAFDRVDELLAMLIMSAERVEAVADAARALAVKVAYS
jgi:hypothetical protein